MKKTAILTCMIGIGIMFLSCGADLEKAADEIRPSIQRMAAVIENASQRMTNVQNADEASVIMKETAGNMKQIILEMKDTEKKYNLTPEESKKLVSLLRTNYNAVGKVLVTLNSNINMVLDKYKDDPKMAEKLMDALLSLREIGSM
jgi:predicted RecB family nuclease